MTYRRMLGTWVPSPSIAGRVNLLLLSYTAVQIFFEIFTLEEFLQRHPDELPLLEPEEGLVEHYACDEK
jgi:hypothetical protein